MKYLPNIRGMAIVLALFSFHLSSVASVAEGVEINKDLVQSCKVLAKGGPLSGANGLAFDIYGQLHIASVNGSEIVVMDPQTGKVLDRMGLAD